MCQSYDSRVEGPGAENVSVCGEHSAGVAPSLVLVGKGLEQSRRMVRPASEHH